MPHTNTQHSPSNTDNPAQYLHQLEQQLKEKQAVLAHCFEELATAVRLLEQERSGKADLQEQIRAIRQQLKLPVEVPPELTADSNIVPLAPPEQLPPLILELTPEEREAHRVHIELITHSDLFDALWYLEAYPDVKASEEFGSQPAAHYTLFGGFEGRKPCLEFDSDFYLRKYEDVRQAKMNPLVHYIQFGCQEGRVFSRLADH